MKRTLEFETAEELAEAMFNTPFEFEGKVVYIVEIQPYGAAIGQFPGLGERAWIDFKKLTVTTKAPKSFRELAIKHMFSVLRETDVLSDMAYEDLSKFIAKHRAKLKKEFGIWLDTTKDKYALSKMNSSDFFEDTDWLYEYIEDILRHKILMYFPIRKKRAKKRD